MTWNLASPDFSVLLSFNVDSQNALLNGTLCFNGTMYAVAGGWAASGVTGRMASAFSVFGSTQAGSPNFIAASGTMTGSGDEPTQIDIRIGVSSSTDGRLSQYSGTLLPSIVDLRAPGTQPFLSGEIDALQSLTATTPVAATIFNNSIVVFTDNNLSTFDLKKLVNSDTDQADPASINTDALALSSNWVHSPDFSTLIQNDWIPDSFSRCSLASTPGAMYFFFNGRKNDSQAFVAYRFAIDQEEAQTPILLFKEPSNQLLPPLARYNPRSNISTTVFSDNIVFFACSAALISEDGGSETYNTFLGVYDTRNIKIDNAGGTWTASWYRYLKSQQWVYDVAVEWFSTIDQDGQPAFYLAVIGSCVYVNSPPVSVVWYIPFTVTTDASGATVVVLSEPSGGRLMNHQPGEDDLIETLVRDPSGRVRGWGRPSAGQPGPGLLRGHILDTLEPPPLDGFVACPRVRERLPASDTRTPPSSLFYVFTPGVTNTTFNGKRATDYPVYEFIFYGGKPTFQVNRYGTIQVVSGTDSQKLPPTPKYVIGGIIDGPIPMPIENFKNDPLVTPVTAATLTYGSSKTEVKSREVSNKRTAGFKSSGKTTKGVGVAWDISLEAGMGSLKGNSEQRTLSYGLTQPAVVTRQTTTAPAVINPNGTLQLCGVQFDLGAYRFLDMFGQPVSDATNADRGQSVKAASILPSLSDSGVGSFLPYAVIPGDLTSYTPEAINKRMQELSKQVKTPGYSGENYYGDIICANAYPFTSDKPYLLFGWSENSHADEGFKQFASSYNENSYTFDHSEYAGISEGFGFDLFGLGVEEEAEFLGGATYSHESTESENNESEWGISLGPDDWGPSRSTELPESIAAYDFRLFFLPVPKSPSTLPSSYWVQELMAHLPPGSDIQVKNIDPGSSCWRIVFVVTRIEYRNGLNSYFYAGDYLDKPSVYADDE